MHDADRCYAKPAGQLAQAEPDARPFDILRGTRNIALPVGTGRPGLLISSNSCLHLQRLQQALRTGCLEQKRLTSADVDIHA
jgi:hypothetical protein